MRRIKSVGIVVGAIVGIMCLVGTLNKKGDPTQLSDQRYVAEFVDRNENGRFDGYRILKITGNKKEYVTPMWPSRSSSEDVRDIYFHTPFGGTMQGEFDKEHLISIYKNLRYPDVDEIKFIGRGIK